MELSLAYAKLLEDSTKAFVQTVEGDIITWAQWSRNRQTSIYPGSFNPIHEGHRSIFSNMGGDRAFEVSIVRWQKPNVTLEELQKRLAQFEGYAPVVITNVARMIEKIAILPCLSLTFHVGIDTLTRMVQDYGEIGVGGLGAKFVVYDRLVSDKVQTLRTELTYIPMNCTQGAPRSMELMKLSSTAIRNSNGT